MAEVTVDTAGLGSNLSAILDAEDIRPGDDPSYQVCKAIYLYHPLGGKICESPVRLAQSQNREITVASAEGIEEMLVERFEETWRALDMSAILLNLRTQARIYGLAGAGLGEKGKDSSAPLDLDELWKADIYFNVFDPLNIPGLIIDQDPNSPTYQKFSDVRVNGKPWHRSRTKVVQNESSIYLAWTSSAYAYAGRSCFQRALYMLKSFLNTMVVDDQVARKAGLLIAKQEQPGSVIDQIMGAMAAVKRWLLKSGGNNQVLSIATTESVESLNLRNVDGALQSARNDIIKNIATAVDMPAKLLTQEAFVEGFGEGTEDAKAVAQFIDRLRIEMEPEYAWADTVVQHRAWSPEWYETVRERYPADFGNVEYKTAFYSWRNNFRAVWPSLIREEPSQLAVIDDIKLKAVIAYVQVHAPLFAAVPELLAELLRWSQAAVNVNETLFRGEKLNLDFDQLLASLKDRQESGQHELEEEENARPNRPFSGHDSAGIAFLKDWAADKRSIAERLAAMNA